MRLNNFTAKPMSFNPAPASGIDDLTWAHYHAAPLFDVYAGRAMQAKSMS